MWSARRGGLVGVGAGGLALACALVLALEARERRGAGTWNAITSGLGVAARAGVAGGFFAYDPRLEALSDSAFAPLPGVRYQDGAAAPGVWEAPSALAPAKPPR